MRRYNNSSKKPKSPLSLITIRYFFSRLLFFKIFWVKILAILTKDDDDYQHDCSHFLAGIQKPNVPIKRLRYTIHAHDKAQKIVCSYKKKYFVYSQYKITNN